MKEHHPSGLSYNAKPISVMDFFYNFSVAKDTLVLTTDSTDFYG